MVMVWVMTQAPISLRLASKMFFSTDSLKTSGAKAPSFPALIGTTKVVP
jgi:hypothetical protein